MTNKVVYFHCRNDNNTIFYVGMGSLKRSTSKYGRNVLWNRIVKKHGFTSHTLCNNLTSQQAKFIEKILIKKYKKMGMDLCNFTDGGDGVCGWVPTEEFRKKVQQRMIGNSNGLEKLKKEPIIGVNLKNGTTIKFCGSKQINKNGIFKSRQVYRCANRDNICHSYSQGIYKGFQFYWESDYLRKVGT
jgi:hypothetical protein